MQNGKNKGELVECRLCLEDTMPACFTNYIIDSEQYDYFLLSVLTVHSVARKSSIVCYSRLLNFSLQFRLWVRKKVILTKVSKMSGKISSCNQRHCTQSKCIVAVYCRSNISTL